MDFNGIENAVGLSYADSDMVKRLVRVLRDRAKRNSLKMKYYEDKEGVKNLGLAVPEKFLSTIDTSVGWCRKAVDMTAVRSQFDGVTMDGEIAERLDKAISDNCFAEEYAKAVPTELINGVGFWTVSKGAPGEPDAIISYHDALTASAIWDYRLKRIKAGMVVSDLAPVGGDDNRLEPCLVHLHTATHVVEIEKRASGQWAARYMSHSLGRPMMEPMCYRPNNEKPLGQSKITRACRGIQDEARRAILRLSLHSEAASQPMRYMLGADEAAFDMDRLSLAYNAFLRVSKDEDGDLPTIGQLEATSPESHIKVLEHLCSRMASETSIPVACFGMTPDRTSSAALAAGMEDLIIEVEHLNAGNARAIRSIMQMVICIITDKPMSELTAEERGITVHWIDPSMPSAAAVADATVKLAAAVPEFGGTDVFWEMNGFNEDMRRRVKSDMAANTQRAIAASVFGA